MTLGRLSELRHYMFAHAQEVHAIHSEVIKVDWLFGSLLLNLGKIQVSFLMFESNSDPCVLVLVPRYSQK